MAESKPKGSTAKAAAEAENNGKPKTLQIEGLTVRLPSKLPFKVLRHLNNQRNASGADVYGILETIIGMEQTDALCDLEVDGQPFDVDQGIEFLTQVLAEYGVNMGESAASPNS